MLHHLLPFLKETSADANALQVEFSVTVHDVHTARILYRRACQRLLQWLTLLPDVATEEHNCGMAPDQFDHGRLFCLPGGNTNLFSFGILEEVKRSRNWITHKEELTVRFRSSRSEPGAARRLSCHTLQLMCKEKNVLAALYGNSDEITRSRCQDTPGNDGGSDNTQWEHVLRALFAGAMPVDPFRRLPRSPFRNQ